MGADIYRQTTDPVREAERLRMQKSGELYDNELWYFRDSYNESALLWRIDLHWYPDVCGFMGPNGDGVLEEVEVDGEPSSDPRLYPEGIRRLAAEVRSRSELLMFNCEKAGLPEVGKEFLDPFGHPDQELDKRYFVEKFDRLLRFLENAASDGDTIWCSI